MKNISYLLSLLLVFSYVSFADEEVKEAPKESEEVAEDVAEEAMDEEAEEDKYQEWKRSIKKSVWNVDDANFGEEMKYTFG